MAQRAELVVKARCRVIVDESSSHTASSTSGGAERRMYTDVDFRLLVGDMLAKFRRHG